MPNSITCAVGVHVPRERSSQYKMHCGGACSPGREALSITCTVGGACSQGEKYKHTVTESQ